MIKQLFLLFSINFGLLIDANAQPPEDFGPPHYIILTTHALESEETQTNLRSSRRNIGRLPGGTLIFVSEREIQIDGEQWKEWITQNGERVFLTDDNKYVSTETFQDGYGENSVIFHENYYICPKGEFECNDSNGFKVLAGYVGRMEEQEGGTVKLVFDVRENIQQTGYLATRKFEDLESAGLVTLAHKKHPRFYIDNITHHQSLSTECGIKRNEINTEALRGEVKLSVSNTGSNTGIAAGINLLTKISRAFGIGFSAEGIMQKGNETEEIVSYGSDQHANDYYTFQIYAWDDDNEEFVKELYLVSVVIGCSGMTYNEYFRIKRVIQEIQIIKSVNNGFQSSHSIKFSSFYPFDTGTDSLADTEQVKRLQSYLGSRVFLTSINGEREYFRVLKIWRTSMPNVDIGLVRIFMNKFNATCKYGNRLKCNKETIEMSKSG